MLHSNLSVNSAGHLVTGQSDVVELAMKYGTPLYILDEDRVRENCRKYKDAMSKYASTRKTEPSIAEPAVGFLPKFPILRQKTRRPFVSLSEH